MRILLTIITVALCYNSAYAASSKLDCGSHTHRQDPACISHQPGKKAAAKHKTSSHTTQPAANENTPIPVAEQSNPPATSTAPCKPGYEPRLAQPQDLTCVSHHIAARTANENAIAIINGKPNPITTNPDLSCKEPDYVARKAKPNDGICVTRSSHAQALVSNADKTY